MVQNQLNQAWLGFGDVTLPLATLALAAFGTMIGVVQPQIQLMLDGLAELSDAQLGVALEGARSLLEELSATQADLVGRGVEVHYEPRPK